MRFDSLKKLSQFVKGALSESDGQGSYSRVSGLLIVLAAVGWVSYLVVTTKTLPDLKGVALLICGAGGQYACNKGEDILKAIRGTSPETEQPAEPKDTL